MNSTQHAAAAQSASDLATSLRNADTAFSDLANSPQQAALAAALADVSAKVVALDAALQSAGVTAKV